MAKSTQRPIYKSFGRRKEKCQVIYRNFYHHLFVTEANVFLRIYIEKYKH